jgi:NAD-reducing hydrogenase large subunit
LSEENRDKILALIPDGLAITQRTLSAFKSLSDNFREEIQTFANFPSLFMGLVGKNGQMEHYDGKLRLTDASGNIIADGIDPRKINDVVEEKVESDSYLKSPYYKPLGEINGMYRVGPLARLNIVDRCGTPLADEEWAEFRSLQRGAVLSSFYFHYARLIEILFCLEQTQGILEKDSILDTHVRAFAKPNRLEGIGVSEAPRGTLMHHYKINRNGRIEWANLVIATGHNNLAMNRGVTQVAKHFVRSEKLQEGMLNRVEAVIRCYDPCLSCSTHAVGNMPMQIELLDPDNNRLDLLVRG